MIIRQIVRYGLVGLSGFFVNLGVFYFCKFIFKVDHNISSVYAFITSVVTNYSLNRYWTFSNSGSCKICFNAGLLKYFFANFFGLILTLCVLNLGIFFYGARLTFYFQALGVSLGMSGNFLLAKFFVFK